jgi:hypothetical protein
VGDHIRPSASLQRTNSFQNWKIGQFASTAALTASGSSWATIFGPAQTASQATHDFPNWQIGAMGNGSMGIAFGGAATLTARGNWATIFGPAQACNGINNFQNWKIGQFASLVVMKLSILLTLFLHGLHTSITDRRANFSGHLDFVAVQVFNLICFSYALAGSNRALSAFTTWVNLALSQISVCFLAIFVFSAADRLDKSGDKNPFQVAQNCSQK